ncbi:glycosyltransferase [Halomarina rubra]|uniref:Glycosyltransferase n=1 Tax=Halomarina rubra TaxID=2071873 RepID=A0ABD6AVE4_9EURY|nr:glycosyltransferase [Halomarina rubra]
MHRDAAVLVIAGLGIWVDGDPKVGKVETHVLPIAETADEVVYVCTGPVPEDGNGVEFHQLEPSRWKPLTLLRQFLAAMLLARRREFDLVASFSLVPYGLFALAVGALSRTPTHLGIIGSDLDVHAESSYGPAVQWLFRRFDVVSVSGSDFRTRLTAMGVPHERTFSVLHPVSSDFADASVADDPTYDVLWLTRMSSEKDPLLFVEALAALRERGVSFTAALVGGGPLEAEVRRAVADRGLDDVVNVPGWANDPVEYYRDARVYVLTSEREMLPLSLVEAMLVGVPSVVPAVGAIPDVVDDGENGLLVADRTPAAYADAIERLLTDETERAEMARAATDVESRLSFEAVGETWAEVFEYVETGRRPSERD